MPGSDILRNALARAGLGGGIAGTDPADGPVAFQPLLVGDKDAFSALPPDIADAAREAARMFDEERAVPAISACLEEHGRVPTRPITASAEAFGYIHAIEDVIGSGEAGELLDACGDALDEAMEAYAGEYLCFLRVEGHDGAGTLIIDGPGGIHAEAPAGAFLGKR